MKIENIEQAEVALRELKKADNAVAKAKNALELEKAKQQELIDALEEFANQTGILGLHSTPDGSFGMAESSLTTKLAIGLTDEIAIQRLIEANLTQFFRTKKELAKDEIKKAFNNKDPNVEALTNIGITCNKPLKFSYK